MGFSCYLQDVVITDAGTYQCTASNVFGTVSKSTDVIVRRRTMIQQAPEDLTVTSGTQAKFVCTALTDPDEAQVGNGRQKSVDYKYLSYLSYV